MDKSTLAASMRAAINQAERSLYKLEKECQSQKINSRDLAADIFRQLALLYALVSHVDAPLYCTAPDDEKECSGLLAED